MVGLGRPSEDTDQEGDRHAEELSDHKPSRAHQEAAVALPDTVSVAIAELASELEEGLLAFVVGTGLSVLKGARRLLTTHSPVVLLEHCGHGNTLGVTPADVRSFLGEVGYRMFLLDGDLSPWDSDEQPPTPNVVAARDVEAVQARLSSPGGAPATAPVRVRVSYLSPTGTSAA
jgi:hypothetical protein